MSKKRHGRAVLKEARSRAQHVGGDLAVDAYVSARGPLAPRARPSSAARPDGACDGLVPGADASRPPALLSVDVEDWGQLVARYLGDHEWDRANAAFPQQMHTMLDLFDRLGARATLFLLGMTAKNYPGVVSDAARRGHRVACHGYSHVSVHRMSPAEFRDDVVRSVDVIGKITGDRPRGYRAPAFSLGRSHVWALEILADLGFDYDSSQIDLFQVPQRLRPSLLTAFQLTLPSGRNIWEVPPAVIRLPAALTIPVAGGSYWRALPFRLIRWGLKKFADQSAAPALYVHPYEFDPQPLRLARGRVAAVKAARAELWANARRGRVGTRLARLAREFRFQPYEEYLGTIDGRD